MRLVPRSDARSPAAGGRRHPRDRPPARVDGGRPACCRTPTTWPRWGTPTTAGAREIGSGAHHHHRGTAVADLVEARAGTPDEKVTLTVRDDGDRLHAQRHLAGAGHPRARRASWSRSRWSTSTCRTASRCTGTGSTSPTPRTASPGSPRTRCAPGERYIYRFVADQAGHLLVPLPPGLPRAGAATGCSGRSWWAASRPAARTEVAVPCTPTTAAARSTAGPATSRRRPQPGEPMRVRVVNTDNGPLRVWVDRAPYRVRRRRRSRPARARLPVSDTAVAGHRGRPGRPPSSPSPEGGAASTSVAPPRWSSAAGRPPGGAAPQPHGSTCCPTAPRRRSASTRASPTGTSTTASAAGPASSTAAPACGGRSTATFPRRADVHGAEGDVVRMTIENHSGEVHPMHLHGHHAVVLSPRRRRGHRQPVVGGLARRRRRARPTRSPSVADNPGIWMDHCHNLPHAAEGLVAHLMYEGVS